MKEEWSQGMMYNIKYYMTELKDYLFADDEYNLSEEWVISTDNGDDGKLFHIRIYYKDKEVFILDYRGSFSCSISLIDNNEIGFLEKRLQELLKKIKDCL